MKRSLAILAAAAAFVLSAAEPANLFNNVWKGGNVWVHTSDPAARPIRSKVLPLIKFEQKDIDGKKVLQTVIPSEIIPLSGKFAQSISASFIQNVKLPDTKGGKYKLTFRYKGSVPANCKSQGLFLVFPKTGNKTGKLYARSWNADSANWKDMKYEFTVPSGADTIEFYFRLNGPGNISFADYFLTSVK